MVGIRRAASMVLAIHMFRYREVLQNAVALIDFECKCETSLVCLELGFRVSSIEE
jgi:hypothetical protein